MMVGTTRSVASGLNCLCPTKRIENSKLAVDFCMNFLCLLKSIYELHSIKSSSQSSILTVGVNWHYLKNNYIR